MKSSTIILFIAIWYDVPALHPGLLFLKLVSVGVLAVAAVWLTLAIKAPRQSTLKPTCSSSVFLGRPLLFPAKLSHTRIFPDKYNYTVPYFMVGIPVGIQGHIGNVLGIGSNQTPSGIPCWFNIEPSPYLHPGGDHLFLNGKLRAALEAQGEDPDEWPYAYFVTSPRFVWWHKNPVSYWYLYSSSMELSAVILEIQNSFGERGMTFSRLTGERPAASRANNVQGKSTRNEAHPVTFVPSQSRYQKWKGGGDKDIFASPFEKIEGKLSFTFSDPLGPMSGSSPGAGPLHATLTTISPEGKTKMMTRLYSWGNPVDPTNASAFEMLKLLLFWTPVVVVTKTLIILEALRLRSRGKMKYHQRPPPKEGSIPREPTSIERRLEPFFRKYLFHLRSKYQSPAKLVYVPSQSHSLKPLSLDSPVAPSWQCTERPTLRIHPLTPEFYTRILFYQDPFEAFRAEVTPTGIDSNPSSKRLAISDQALLEDVVRAAETPASQTGRVRPRTFAHCRRRIVIAYLRGGEQETFMDKFVYSHLPPELQRTYQKATLEHLLKERTAFSSNVLYTVYKWISFFAGGLLLTWVVKLGITW